MRVFGYRAARKKASAIREILKKTPMFMELSDRELAAIERILHRREYAAGEAIIRQGEPGLGMYIVEEGRASVLSEPANVELSELMEGDFFGEASLLDESPRSATVLAKDPSRVLAFFQSDLFALIESDPRLGVKVVIRLARHIGDRLKKANQQVLALTEELHRRPARKTKS
jgi:CRP-like cAMP-binding protein